MNEPIGLGAIIVHALSCVLTAFVVWIIYRELDE